MPLLFSYGSNSPAQLSERLERKIKGSAAYLPAHGRYFRGWSRRWKGGVATVLPNEDLTVYGYVANVTPDELHILDRREGVLMRRPSYKRIRKRVYVRKGRDYVPKYAQIYVSLSTEHYPPSTAYHEAVAETISAFWQGKEGRVTKKDVPVRNPESTRILILVHPDTAWENQRGDMDDPSAYWQRLMDAVPHYTRTYVIWFLPYGRAEVLLSGSWGRQTPRTVTAYKRFRHFMEDHAQTWQDDLSGGRKRNFWRDRLEEDILDLAESGPVTVCFGGGHREMCLANAVKNYTAYRRKLEDLLSEAQIQPPLTYNPRIKANPMTKKELKELHRTIYMGTGINWWEDEDNYGRYQKGLPPKGVNSKDAHYELIETPPSKKRSKRPSPSVSATKFRVGTRRKGNDGKMWKVKATVKGVRRWVKTGTTAKRKKKTILKQRTIPFKKPTKAEAAFRKEVGRIGGKVPGVTWQGKKNNHEGGSDHG